MERKSLTKDLPQLDKGWQLQAPCYKHLYHTAPFGVCDWNL